MKGSQKKKKRRFSSPAKNRGMGTALRRILLIIYLVTAIPLAACYLSQWVSPAAVWPLAFFGLLFHFLIALQLVFLVLFLVVRSKAVILPVIMVLTGWSAINNTFQVFRSPGGEHGNGPNIRVMTYNVKLFDIANWSGLKNQSDGIFSYIDENKPDIICFQEFAIQNTGKITIDYIRKRLDYLPYSTIEYNFTSGNRQHGLAIFSRYPIAGNGHEHFQDTRNMMLYADLKIDSDTFRVFNNHLESIHFDRDEFQWIDTTSNPSRIPRDKITEIMKRMKSAYIKRASQADLVRKSIHASPHPVIVCGDFNDTPVSYATNQIRGNLRDSFRSGGYWLGITFPNVIAPLRIDYILHPKNMVSSDYRIGKVKYSDHRPVSCLIGLNPQ